ncbi:hypothetical protein D3C86_1525000 [compost metagenome]
MRQVPKGERDPPLSSLAGQPEFRRHNLPLFGLLVQFRLLLWDGVLLPLLCFDLPCRWRGGSRFCLRLHGLLGRMGLVQIGGLVGVQIDRIIGGHRYIEERQIQPLGQPVGDHQRLAHQLQVCLDHGPIGFVFAHDHRLVDHLAGIGRQLVLDPLV